jgi:hypothetical protein
LGGHEAGYLQSKGMHRSMPGDKKQPINKHTNGAIAAALLIVRNSFKSNINHLPNNGF